MRVPECFLLLIIPLWPPVSTSGTSCGPDEFACLDADECEPDGFFCDGIPDCSDNSDEINPQDATVSGITCLAKEGRTCKLPSNQDWKYCATSLPCNAHQFACLDQSRCLPRTWFCDGYADCSDNSDEIHPHNTTVNGTYCLVSRQICKLPANQEWKSKEFCAKRTSCNNDEFACLDESGCLPGNLFCNGHKDCRDNSDELHRQTTEVNGTLCRVKNGRICKLHTNQNWKFQDLCSNNTSCNDDEFSCLDGSGCLQRSLFCDGIFQCSDGSDERSFDGQALNGEILHKNCLLGPEYVCNGRNNTEDGKDEFLCSKMEPNKKLYLDEKHFRCLSMNEVISAGKVCDGIIDCLDLSDECMCLRDEPEVCNHVNWKFSGARIQQFVYCNDSSSALQNATVESVCNKK